VAGLGEENPRNLLGVDLDGHRIVPWTIENGGNLARDTDAAGGIFVELALAGFGYDNFWHSISRFLIRARTLWGSAPFVEKLGVRG
jgi:hypothetical protein